ncbi:MAG: hypothetical protein NDF56_00880 [archaeon GB-1845-036]|nr:hypothetical protein [Candidatus Culexmicrobium thermophilum]HDO21014.1 hypothetical protein [Candidatus Bathyarchaeota archaeon]
MFKLKSPLSFVLLNLFYLLSLSYILFNNVFSRGLSELSLIYAVLFGIISLLYGYVIGELKKAFIGYVASIFLSVGLTMLLIRVPVQWNIGWIAAELVTMWSLRNTLMYLLLVLSPISLILIPIGIYLSTLLGKPSQIKFIFILITLLFSSLLVVNYANYNCEVYSVKLLDVNVKNVNLFFKGEHVYVNLTYSMMNRGVSVLKCSMVIYNIYLGNELCRVYSENFQGSMILLNPSNIVERNVKIEVPMFKLKRNMLHGCVNLSLTFEVYVRSRFGVTPITYHYAAFLKVSPPLSL